MNKTFIVKTITKGKNPTQWLKEVDDKIHFEFQARLAELGELTAERMKEIIKSSIKREGSTGLLENAIKSEILDATGGVHIGIGRISELPPYWEVLNAGGYVPPANLGFFGIDEPPRSGASGQKWTHTGDKSDFFMKPKKPIEPVRYVDISGEELNKHIEKEIKRLYKEIDNLSK